MPRRVLFLVFFFRHNGKGFVRDRCCKMLPGGDVVLVRLYEEVSRENVRSECGGKGGFRCTHVRPGYIRHPLPPLSVSLSLFLFLLFVYPFQTGGAANQSFLREHDGRRR